MNNDQKMKKKVLNLLQDFQFFNLINHILITRALKIAK